MVSQTEASERMGTWVALEAVIDRLSRSKQQGVAFAGTQTHFARNTHTFQLLL